LVVIPNKNIRDFNLPALGLVFGVVAFAFLGGYEQDVVE